MQIRLAHSFAKHIELKNPLASDDILEKAVTDIESNEAEEHFELSFSVAYHEKRQNEFAVIFKVTVHLASGWILDVEYISIFETTVPIDKAFQGSPFPIVNAPAIAFPFLRSFVATFLLNAGHPTVIFPSINFTKFDKGRKEKI